MAELPLSTAIYQLRLVLAGISPIPYGQNIHAARL
jgi:hypothetical protein